MEELVVEFAFDARILPIMLTVDQDTAEFCMTFLQLLTLPTYIEIEESVETESDEMVSVDFFACMLFRINAIRISA